MKNTLDPRYRRCERIGKSVRIDRTEGQCRDEHRCPDDRCLLETQFAGDEFAARTTRLAGLFAGWLALSPKR